MSIKLIVSGIGVAVLVGAGWLVNGWRTERLDLKHQLAYEIELKEGYKQDYEACKATVDQLRAEVDSVNTVVSKLGEDKLALEAEIREQDRSILTERLTWAKRLAEATKPLPIDLEVKLREAARRLGAQK